MRLFGVGVVIVAWCVDIRSIAPCTVTASVKSRATPPMTTSLPERSRMTDTVVQDTQLADFTDYFVRNYPGFGEPEKHAPNILRAAQYVLRAELEALRRLRNNVSDIPGLPPPDDVMRAVWAMARSGPNYDGREKNVIDAVHAYARKCIALYVAQELT